MSRRERLAGGRLKLDWTTYKIRQSSDLGLTYALKSSEKAVTVAYSHAVLTTKLFSALIAYFVVIAIR